MALLFTYCIEKNWTNPKWTCPSPPHLLPYLYLCPYNLSSLLWPWRLPTLQPQLLNASSPPLHVNDVDTILPVSGSLPTHSKILSRHGLWSCMMFWLLPSIFLTSSPTTSPPYFLCCSYTVFLALPWTHQAHSCLRAFEHAMPCTSNDLPTNVHMAYSLYILIPGLNVILSRN